MSDSPAVEAWLNANGFASSAAPVASETPDTDALCFALRSERAEAEEWLSELKKHARTLERQRNAALSQREVEPQSIQVSAMPEDAVTYTAYLPDGSHPQVVKRADYDALRSALTTALGQREEGVLYRSLAAKVAQVDELQEKLFAAESRAAAIRAETVEAVRDAERWRFLLANSTRMSEPLFVAGSNTPAGHRVSLIIDLDGPAPWATAETFTAAIDRALPAPQARPVEDYREWTHPCDGVCNHVTLWVARCPHCGMPRPAPQARPSEGDKEGRGERRQGERRVTPPVADSPMRRMWNRRKP